MADSLELPTLYVEGDADLHTVIHLLGRHGVVLDKDIGPVIVKKAKNDHGVLDSMRTATRASTLRPVGFVIDADTPVADRWKSICDHLKDVGLVLPTSPPPEGFVEESSETKSKVGVWIMPDNQTNAGRLEDLVKTLVPKDDKLFPLAKSSTGEAAKLGAKIQAGKPEKAELHCWLAWQAEPGLPFGTALKAHFFAHQSDVANAFVAWFKRLYGLT